VRRANYDSLLLLNIDEAEAKNKIYGAGSTV
jgi:hypothetical protein